VRLEVYQRMTVCAKSIGARLVPQRLLRGMPDFLAGRYVAGPILHERV